MALSRTAIPDFQVANSAYIAALVTFFVANPDGTPSATIATLYADLAGLATLPNPQRLDSTGKFLAPAYISQDVVGSVSSGAGSGLTGVISYGGSARGTYATATRYSSHDIIEGPVGQAPDVTGNLYFTNQIFDSTNWAADLPKLTLIFDYQALAAGVVPFSSIAAAKAGTSVTAAVTPDAMASFWQQGADIASAATLAKPADASLGGVHRVTGNVGIDNFWAGSVDGEELELRFPGTPNLTVAGNLLPPASLAFQTVAGDMIRWRWDGTAVKWRAYGGMRADGTALVATGTGGYLAKAVNYNPIAGDAGKEIDFTVSGTTCQILATAGFPITVSNSAAAGDVTLSMSAGNLDGQATRKLRPGDTVNIRGTGGAGKTLLGDYSYQSAQTIIAAGDNKILAHGLGVKPTTPPTVTLINITADAGYTANQEILLSPMNYAGLADFRAIGLGWDTVNIIVQIGSSGLGYATNGSGAEVTLDLTKWKMIVRARTK